MEVLGFGVLRLRGFRCNWGLRSRWGLRIIRRIVEVLIVGFYRDCVE